MALAGQKNIQVMETETLRALLATSLVPDRSVAIDGGAHVGGWTEIMASEFGKVIAFEPSEAYENLVVNCGGLPNVELVYGALMDECATVTVFSPGRDTLTARQVRKSVDGGVSAYSIDSLNLQRLGLLKLDIEGCELYALRGAVKTIARCKPFILCEMAGNGKKRHIKDKDVKNFIKSLGYRHTFMHNVDYGYSPI